MLITWRKLIWRLIWIWLIGLCLLVLLLLLQTIGVGSTNPAYAARIWTWFLFASLPLSLAFIASLFPAAWQHNRLPRYYRTAISLLLILYLFLLLSRPIYAALGFSDAAAAERLFELPDWFALVVQFIVLGLLGSALFFRSISPVRDLPTVVFAFSNATEDHLPLLKEESRSLMQHLGPLHDQQVLELHREESSTLQELINIFNRFDQRMAIFHFGGHAGGTGLITESGEARADGLATLLHQQRDNLALVFLNGCSTLPQVERLLDLGIKAVIATAVPVADQRAQEFADWFYQALAGGRSLEQSFIFAAASMQTKYQDAEQPQIVQYRSLKLDDEEAGNRPFPWGLYVNNHDKKILDWRLPIGT